MKTTVAHNIKDLLNSQVQQLKNNTSLKFVSNQFPKEIENAPKGIPSGFEDIDKITNGWQKGDVMVLAAPAGMGKTVFALNLIRNAAIDYNVSSLYFSMRLDATQISNKLLSAETNIPYEKFQANKLTASEIEKTTTQIHSLEKSPLRIIDSAIISVENLCEQIRLQKTKNNIELLVIDSLQDIYLEEEENTTMIKHWYYQKKKCASRIVQHLNALAKELNIAIILLSDITMLSSKLFKNKFYEWKINRVLYKMGIAQYADGTTFIYRPEYYGNETFFDGGPSEKMADIIITHYRRHITQETARVHFYGQYQRFENKKYWESWTKQLKTN